MSSTGSVSPTEVGWHRREASGRLVLVEDVPQGSTSQQEAATGPAAVAAAPSAVIGPDGGPVLSLVVVLERQPPPDEPSVIPLVQSSTLSFDVAVGLSDDDLAALDASSGREHHRLFMSRVDYRLYRSVGDVREPDLATGSAQGTVGRAALSASLDREGTLDVLAALRGAPSAWTVEALVRYARRSGPQKLWFRAAWADIWDALAARAVDGVVDLDTVGHAVRDLLADDRLTVTPDTEPVDPDEVARLVLTQASVVLDRSEPSSWHLRPRPHPAAAFDYMSTLSSRATSTLSLTASLDRILGGSLTGLPLDRYVSLVAPSSRGGVTPVAARRKGRGSRADGQSTGATVLAVNNGRLESLAVFAEPRRVSTAAAVFAASAAGRPALAVERPPALEHLQLDDMRVLLPGDRSESLPVVDDVEAAAWSDRHDRRVRWYAPRTELVRPDPSAQPGESPFLFRFHRTGVTDDSRPALEATITLTVRRTAAPGADRSSVKSLLREVPVQKVTAALEVPFVDRADGSPKYQTLAGTVLPTEDGWSVQIRAVNDWVRICYRALSAAVPDAQPAMLRLDYTFSGYTPVHRGKWHVALQRSTAVLPVVFAARDFDMAEDRTVFDARAMTLHTGAADIVFRREAPGEAREGNGAVGIQPSEGAGVRATAARRAPGAVTRKPKPLDRGRVRAKPSVVALEPQMRPFTPPVFADPVVFAKRSFARRLTVPVQLSCASFGHLYRETTSSGDVPVGCQNALQLGELRYSLFAELPAHRTEHCSVHRLLQQPGRFVVAPTRYGITRHEASEGELAYRPCVVLYAVLDLEVAENNRVQLDVTLQPDLGVDARAELLSELRALDPHPQLLLPTEVDGVRATFDWALPKTGTTVSTTVLAGGLVRVGITCSLPDWLLLRLQLERMSVSGTATFDYPDGSSLRAALTVDLARMLGPWESGPVEAALTGTRAVLTNRTESAVDIGDLICTTPDGRTRVAVARSLEAGESVDVPVPSTVTSVLPAVTVPRGEPVKIEESRSFMDSLETNVIFLNLIALGARKVSRLSIDARIRGLPGEQDTQLTDAVPTAEVRFVLPLATYLTIRVLEYRVTVHHADEDPTVGAWVPWNLAAQGNIIGLAWEQVEPTSGGQTDERRSAEA